MFLTITILQVIVIVTGLACLRKGGPVILNLLLVINILGFINENLIVIHSREWWNVKRNVFYNLYSFFEILCWMFIYYQVFIKTIMKGTVIFFGCFILLYSLLEVFVFYGPEVFHTLSYACFSMFSLSFSGIYIFKINGKGYHNLTTDPVFWICAGAICFQSVFLVNLFTLLDPGYWEHAAAQQVFHMLQSIALIIYYILLCIAFILFYCRHQQESTRYL
jgi:hypothetical protein